MNSIAASELIINDRGAIYHVNCRPEEIANTIITVGDPDRISSITQHFDRIELKKGKREFLTQTGYIGSKRITVVSTGIGTDNIDIVLNELDALVNIDFESREVKPQLTGLDIIRIGTSGAIQEDLPMGTILASSFGLGLDTLMNYYVHEVPAAEQELFEQIKAHLSDAVSVHPYLTAADPYLLGHIGEDMEKGITVTAPGFYAPQGRIVRAQNSVPDLIQKLNTFRHGSYRLTNLEMETAGIYALAKILGHRALSVNAILASRVNFQFSTEPNKIVDRAIQLVLQQLTSS